MLSGEVIMVILTIILITLVLASVVMLLSSILAKKTMTDREKNSPFECGFDPKGSARLPFSLRFFLIAIIFLIFDVEITLLLPLIIIMTQTQIKPWLFMGVFFFLILLLGLYYEWFYGALDWSE